MALIYLGYRKLKGRNKKKKGDDSEEVEEKTVESEMEAEAMAGKKKTVCETSFIMIRVVKAGKLNVERR